MSDVGPDELAFAVLCLSHDTFIVVAEDAHHFSRCDALAV